MLFMSIEVRANTSVSTLRTCIEVLSEHVVCTKQSTSFEFSFLVLLTLSLTHTHSVYLHCFSVFFVSIRLSRL